MYSLRVTPFVKCFTVGIFTIAVIHERIHKALKNIESFGI